MFCPNSVSLHIVTICSNVKYYTTVERASVMVLGLHLCEQYFSYIVAVSLLVDETGLPEENHRPAASH